MRYMIKSKLYLLLLCLFVAGCSSTPVVSNQHSSNQAPLAQEQKYASKESNVPHYSHETVTEAYDGGTKFLELVSDSQE
jgi:PBP1b-binding outer membrane lipoprotein LpoB